MPSYFGLKTRFDEKKPTNEDLVKFEKKKVDERQRV